MRGVDVISVYLLLWATFLLALEDPRKDFKHVKNTFTASEVDIKEHNRRANGHPISSRKDTNMQRMTWDEPYPANLLPRLRWVFTLLASLRLNTWKTGSSSSHDERQAHVTPPSTRRAFFLRNILPQIVLSWSILSLTTHLASKWPAYTGLNSPKETGVLSDVLQSYLPVDVLQPLTLGLHAYAILTLQYLIPAPLALLSNYLFNFPQDSWSLHTLPPRFGSFSTVLDKGLAGLWGKWWHQVCSAFCSQCQHTTNVDRICALLYPHQAEQLQGTSN